MTPDIQTIFFDVGNTLRIVMPDQEFIDKAEAGLMELIQTKESHDELFAKLEHLIGKPLIRKERRGYALPGGLTLEVNCVDPDTATGFWYAEVEFETEAQALAWNPADAGLAAYLCDECTGRPGASMGEYWLQTRGDAQN